MKKSALPFSLFLALKYLRPKRAFFSVVTLLTITGVLLGVAVLVIVLSVMSGFNVLWREKILSFNAHLTVQGYGPITNPGELSDAIEAVPGVTGAAPYVQGLVFIQQGDRIFTPILRGVDPAREARVSKVPESIRQGRFSLAEGEVVLGADLARQMGVRVGDTLLVYSPLTFSRDGTLRLPEELTVSGLFDLGMWDFDIGFAISSMETAGYLFGMEEGAQAIQVMTEAPMEAALVAPKVDEALHGDYHVETWMTQNRQLLGVLSVEKNMMFFLLIIISIVAGFSVCNSLIMVAVQKTRDIGLLKAVGFSSRSVMGVFFWQGWLAGLIGTGLGIGTGLVFLHYRNDVLRFLSRRFGLELFPKEFYQLGEIPAATSFQDVALVALCVMVVCTLAGIIPAWRAARLDPVRALRYE